MKERGGGNYIQKRKKIRNINETQEGQMRRDNKEKLYETKGGTKNKGRKAVEENKWNKERRAVEENKWNKERKAVEENKWNKGRKIYERRGEVENNKCNKRRKIKETKGRK